jgi:phosphatidylethanolamine/phosphatidyl-N-methylethanolamine N-methyltransferase
MPLNTNAWNRVRYTWWAPLYDRVVHRFEPFRRASIESMDLSAGQRLLLVGAGTGADLKHIPPGVRVMATDLTESMLRRARVKASADVCLAVMDGHHLALPTAAFDAAALHLIVAVIPDPVQCLREVARVVRPGGRIAVFDKFVRGARPPLGLRLANLVTGTLFTDVTRNFEAILQASAAPLEVERDAPAALRGLFRHVLLRRL